MLVNLYKGKSTYWLLFNPTLEMIEYRLSRIRNWNCFYNLHILLTDILYSWIYSNSDQYFSLLRWIINTSFILFTVSKRPWISSKRIKLRIPFIIHTPPSQICYRKYNEDDNSWKNYFGLFGQLWVKPST